MDGRRVVQRLVNGETALDIARSFGYRSPTPVMDAARDFIVAKLGAERYSAFRLARDRLRANRQDARQRGAEEGLSLAVATRPSNVIAARATNDAALPSVGRVGQ